MLHTSTDCSWPTYHSSSSIYTHQFRLCLSFGRTIPKRCWPCRKSSHFSLARKVVVKGNDTTYGFDPKHRQWWCSLPCCWPSLCWMDSKSYSYQGTSSFHRTNAMASTIGSSKWLLLIHCPQIHRWSSKIQTQWSNPRKMSYLHTGRTT